MDLDKLPEEGRRRVQIERVRPEIDGGRFPIKRILGDRIDVSAIVYADGHDLLACSLLYRPAPSLGDPDPPWLFVPLEPTAEPDRFVASFTPDTLGLWQYTVEAFIDRYGTFRRDLKKRVEAAQDVSVDILDGATLLEQAAKDATGDDARSLADVAARLRDDTIPLTERITLALDSGLCMAAARHPDRRLASRYPGILEVVVDPEKARFSSWYELFPRSFGEGGRHGTFADAEARLPYVADLGFDILYLPPIHPIGQTNRKGKNNTLVAEHGDVGSPWAIGAPQGGHTAVHPSLGTLDDFDRFFQAAARLGIDIALDIALQASPDHPWVQEHPGWFPRRADGTARYAENPPKKYQDIHPFDFETEEWPELWRSLEGIFRFWIARGVRFFRVDNPHTKPLPFWEWVIRSIKRDHPEVVFLSEAFTRPALMYGLAKRGFSQSYTYFTWRVSKDEITSYMHDLTKTEIAEFYRPNFWPNTPDILPEHLQNGQPAAFLVRLVLAATLSSSYGIYGPAFELMEHKPPREGAEEYADSEKYELRRWDLRRPDSLRPMITRINRIRMEHPALARNDNLQFFHTDSDLVLAYGKTHGDDSLIVVVNLDPYHRHGAWVELDLPGLTDAGRGFEVHDLLSGARYTFRGKRNWVEIDPRTSPACVFHARRLARRENDYEYFL
ncbi:alpha-1,4-glucan--maltose-1-phosphate maltosyltransferase [Polyangium jinanense]|uniref:alpha-1,4-glucan--maltose-1-phosphate maltosyltransferase n=1 Tax=Polyangium jinanense TaxID=2829994 RepID=UPI002342379F|nr:alpha-1,4-glucan--maltose-1-phosphate maltosyltransferase [Polyangium jinanense]